MLLDLVGWKIYRQPVQMLDETENHICFLYFFGDIRLIRLISHHLPYIPSLKKKLWHYGFPPNCPINTQNPKYTLVESGFLITFPIKPINLSCASVAFVSGAWESWLICYEYASSSRLKFLKWVSKMVVSQNG